jgi:hypothetical protein
MRMHHEEDVDAGVADGSGGVEQWVESEGRVRGAMMGRLVGGLDSALEFMEGSVMRE